MSPAYSESKDVSAKDQHPKAPKGYDNNFHTVLGAFGGSSAVYKPSSDLFSHAK
jgi:hypothetical protein